MMLFFHFFRHFFQDIDAFSGDSYFLSLLSLDNLFPFRFFSIQRKDTYYVPKYDVSPLDALVVLKQTHFWQFPSRWIS